MWIRLFDLQIAIYSLGVLIAMIGIIHTVKWWKIKLVQQNLYLYAHKPGQYEIFKNWHQFETKFIFKNFNRIWLSWYLVIEELIITRTVTILFEKLAQLEIKPFERGDANGGAQSK